MGDKRYKYRDSPERHLRVVGLERGRKIDVDEQYLRDHQTHGGKDLHRFGGNRRESDISEIEDRVLAATAARVRGFERV